MMAVAGPPRTFLLRANALLITDLHAARQISRANISGWRWREAHKYMANGLNAAVFSSVKSILSDSNRDRPRDRQIGSIASNGIDKKKIQRK